MALPIDFVDPDSNSRVPVFNPFWKELRSNPYPIYAYYREHDPVHWGLPNLPYGPGCWYLFRYEDIHSVLTDPRFGRESLHAFLGRPYIPPPEPYTKFMEFISKWILFRDPPYHTKLKTPLADTFKPITVKGRKQSIEKHANDLIDRLLPLKQADLINDFAVPFPILVISDLIGIQIENLDQVRKWARDLVAGIDVRDSNRAMTAAGQTVSEMTSFLQEIIADRVQNPREDLISTLVAYQEKNAAYREDELIASCALILFAGHETTMNLIGNGMLALLENEEALDELLNDAELIPAAVGEMVRFNSPVQMTSRTAYEDVEINGKRIAKGQEVGIILGSANRDPEMFPDPNRLNFRRSENRHDGFGRGVHYCIGSHLSLLEAQIAFRLILERMPRPRLITQGLEWKDGISFHGLKTLPVAFG